MTSAARRVRRGFTLLEMVVVLSILGLATAMAVPAVLRSIDTWQRRGDVEAVLDQIRGLPAAARAQGRDLVISRDTLSAADAPIRLGEGRTLTTAQPWRVRYNGVCDGGIIELENGERMTRIVVSPPFCDPQVNPD